MTSTIVKSALSGLESSCDDCAVRRSSGSDCPLPSLLKWVHRGASERTATRRSVYFDSLSPLTRQDSIYTAHTVGILLVGVIKKSGESDRGPVTAAGCLLHRQVRWKITLSPKSYKSSMKLYFFF
jgi:hypothetical protein